MFNLFQIWPVELLQAGSMVFWQVPIILVALLLSSDTKCPRLLINPWDRCYYYHPLIRDTETQEQLRIMQLVSYGTRIVNPDHLAQAWVFLPNF